MKLIHTITSSIVLATTATTASADCKTCTSSDSTKLITTEAVAPQAPEDVTFSVKGMTCEMCSGRITKALKTAEGVTPKSVSHKSGDVVITIDPAVTSKQEVAALIKKTGYKVIGEKLTIPVSGMTCEKCSEKVTTAIQAIDGVTATSVNHKTGQATVTIDTTKTSKATVLKAINKTGFKTTSVAD